MSNLTLLYTKLLTNVNHLVYIIYMRNIYRVKISKILATNLKDLREYRRLTLDQLGAAIGVSRQAIWNLENEQSWITLDKVEKLSVFFDVEQDQLFQKGTIKNKKGKI